ncbi:MAG: 1-acyl-sn-glycerol-3-phosphate acyltransferase [Dysgonamonadaceae bacterium]|jgi:putative hemolysin|nr:1-acyl-sn-glycerol-3-phosphate acyltransferase [Dysgonamonadaceae bacterium]
MEESKFFHIDIQGIINTKAPRAAKKIPKRIVKSLAKLICQDEVNQFLEYNGNARGVDFMNNAVKYFDIKLQVLGEDNLPDSGTRCIFASNHPLGGMDGVCLSSFLGNHYGGKIKYLVNDILYFLQPLQDIFVPINKHGAQNRSAVRILNEVFASGDQIITFPAGLCSRKTKNGIRDLEWKKMFIVKAIEYQRDIVPVHFEGKNSNLFYNIANLRKYSGLKFNIEMLFLPGELFKAKGSTFTIRFGKPIPRQTFDASKTPQEWADWVKQTVYTLHKN